MSFTDRLAQLRARFLSWLAALRTSGSGSREKMPSAQRTELITLLNKGRSAQRWLAAEALGEADPGRDGVSALAAALASDDPLLRAEAGNALAQIGGRSVRNALLESASSANPAAQAAAADALGRLPVDEATAGALQTLLNSPEPAVRQSAAEALARTGWPSPRSSIENRVDPCPRLLELLADDREPMARRAAALALGTLGDPAAREALTTRLEDPGEDWRVREAAALALSRLPVDSAVADSGESAADAPAEAETSELSE